MTIYMHEATELENTIQIGARRLMRFLLLNAVMAHT
jgi:hypothetical protein